MKRNHLLLVLLAFMVVGITLVLRLWPRTLPESQCSPVYQRYAQVAGIEASFVKDFPINDTLAIDVTLLHAKDSAGWQYLVEAFHIPSEILEEPYIFLHQSLKDHPEEPFNSANNTNPKQPPLEQVAIDIGNQEICVFHTQNIQDFNAVFDKKIDSNI